MLKHKGFSLIELMIAMGIALTLSIAMTNITAEQKHSYLLQKAQLEVIDKSQILQSILHQQLSDIGAFNPFDSNTYGTLGIGIERPVIFEGDISIAQGLGSKDNIETPDSLVFHKFGNRVCSGARFKNVLFEQNPNLRFHAIEELFVDKNQLKCRAYDGGYLTENKQNELSNHSVTLLENVYDVQFRYLVLSGTRWQWLELGDYKAMFKRASSKVTLKAIGVDVLLRSDTGFQFDNLKLVNQSRWFKAKPMDDGLYFLHQQTVQVAEFNLD